ncbi:MAG TPA: exopolyphosphatase [Candidatus Marinimicrobia bacterium]|nr:exopolyphosphatase [Candidatus Neomarinimicrobiota bacterium]HIB03692.1 exopolyphosphatase [Candidatus Neomarinimicrobiota bacterium]HIB71632.1 exopolyphosphatase [Candidatus Neomarinimicrobiota bacterium]HIB96152.1 exopolyphosphatase [Candidatus Neomarinimicrobiota bacterium]HIN62277.1 exopolyphosphatase [Candidatus Neomarinimicrobiota bacterium]
MRVIYRGDLDGSVCAAILMDVGLCDTLEQAHPKDMQEGKVDITSEDIICNLPYHPSCHMWFDHHSSEISRPDMPTDFTGLVDVAPSAANLVYKYFIEDYPELKKYEGLVHETDLVDSADLTLEQVANPQGTILLGLLLDPRTGLGLQRDMNISNFQWVSSVPELLTKHSVEEILAMQDTAERIDRYNDMHNIASEFYSANSRMEGNVIMTDVRGMDVPPANRFLIYTLPELSDGNISVRIADGKKGEFDTISVAHSIFNRTSNVDSGELCKSYGGGGHKGAATCQPNLEDSEGVLQGIIEACKE